MEMVDTVSTKGTLVEMMDTNGIAAGDSDDSTMEGVAKVYSDRWLMACMEVSMVPKVTTKSD